MATVTLAQDTGKGGSRGLFASLIAFFEIAGAAIRVARAAETRTPAHAEDLAVLGIKGPLPRAW